MHDFFPRIIPVLLLKNKGLYKGVKFKNHSYVGDPLNAVKIFNDKGADELLFLDIDATASATALNYDLIAQIAGECFMPLSYGGGIQTLEQIRTIIGLGVEKVVINTEAINSSEFIQQAVQEFGSSTICVCIDYKKNMLGKRLVYQRNGTQKTQWDPLQWAYQLEQWGVGEIILQNITADGTMTGYDFDYFKTFQKSLSVPLIIAGGAKGIEDFKSGIQEHQILNMAGGACFVYYGVHRAVLISYPNLNQLN